MRVMPITTTSVQHIRLTVTDITRSRAFYESVFGWPGALEGPAGADAETREKLWFLYGGVLYRAGQMLVGLRPVADDRFDENRVGLDHLAFLRARRPNWMRSQRTSTSWPLPTSPSRTSVHHTSSGSAIPTTSPW